jgi:hypothetical protein
MIKVYQKHYSKLTLELFLKNIILVICTLLFLPSCTHIGGLSHDTQECRAIAYDNNAKLYENDADIAFSQCLKQKKNLREQKTTKANIDLWGEFITDLLFGEKEPNAQQKVDLIDI